MSGFVDKKQLEELKQAAAAADVPMTPSGLGHLVSEALQNEIQHWPLDIAGSQPKPTRRAGPSTLNPQRPTTW